MLNGSGIIALEWSFLGLALLFVLLRLYVRVYKPHNTYDRSDYIVVAAWLNFAAYCVCDAKLHSLESDASYVTGDLTKLGSDPEKNTKILKLIYWATFPYLVDLWLIKAGVLSFYYTIIPRSLPVYRLFLHIVAGISVITFILVFIGNMFWCIPVKRNWSLKMEERCIASAMPIPFFGVVSSTIATDLMIFCLPFPLVRSMTLPRRKMVGIFIVFALGFLTIFASICRVIALSIQATFAAVTIWSAVECCTGIMLVCVPALRVLIIRRETSSYPSRNKSIHSSRNKSNRSSRNKSYPRHTGPSILSAADRNEIWDGTDATAPEWIRMASLPSANSVMISPKTAQFDDSVDLALSKQLASTRGDSMEYGSSMSDFSMVTAVPNLRLQLGRGIVEHASMSPPISPTSGPRQFGGLSTSFPSPISALDSSNTNFVRLHDPDDVLPYTLNRWDTGESGRLELGRIVDIAAGVNRPRSVAVPHGRIRLESSSSDLDEILK